MTGKELSDHLRRKGYSQTDVARAMGTTQQNIQYIFRAKSVKVEKLQTIAKALGKDMSFFLPEDEGECNRLRAELQAKDEEIKTLNERIDKLVEIIRKAKLS